MGIFPFTNRHLHQPVQFERSIVLFRAPALFGSFNRHFRPNHGEIKRVDNEGDSFPSTSLLYFETQQSTVRIAKDQANEW